MSKIDQSQSCLIGVGEDRKDKIRDPAKRTCCGCGGPVYFSADLIPIAFDASRARGERLQFVCPKCAEPCFDRIAAEGGDLAGTPAALAEVMPTIRERRRRFLQSN
jgi:hypothetical protein